MVARALAVLAVFASMPDLYLTRYNFFQSRSTRPVLSTRPYATAIKCSM